MLYSYINFYIFCCTSLFFSTHINVSSGCENIICGIDLDKQGQQSMIGEGRTLKTQRIKVLL